MPYAGGRTDGLTTEITWGIQRAPLVRIDESLCKWNSNRDGRYPLKFFYPDIPSRFSRKDRSEDLKKRRLFTTPDAALVASDPSVKVASDH